MEYIRISGYSLRYSTNTIDIEYLAKIVEYDRIISVEFEYFHKIWEKNNDY